MRAGARVNAPQVDADVAIGATAAAVGSTGLTIQLVAEFINLGVLGINAVIAAGGLYLLWLRIRRAHRQEWDGNERRDYERRDGTSD